MVVPANLRKSGEITVISLLPPKFVFITVKIQN